jgi:hypothetical protein
VRPILEGRCVVCHACYDAPCQLKLGSAEGIDRGANSDKVYDGRRLRQAELTRLFEDAQTTAQWREKDFHPVLNERAQTREANREAGLMHRLLELKRSHPVEPGALLPDDVDLRLRRDEKCPTVASSVATSASTPSGACPTASRAQRARARDRDPLARGGGHAPPAARAPAGSRAQVAAVGAVPEPGLAPRPASPVAISTSTCSSRTCTSTASGAPPTFFELVRSRTPPGQPIDRIATRRPYDDPGVARPYYRLQPVREAIVAKLHLPYRSTPPACSAGRRCSTTPPTRSRRCPRTPRRSPPTPSSRFGRCRCSRATASCSTRPSSR